MFNFSAEENYFVVGARPPGDGFVRSQSELPQYAVGARSPGEKVDLLSRKLGVWVYNKLLRRPTIKVGIAFGGLIQ